jgi:O-antigen/teichoic acid export membrane protein
MNIIYIIPIFAAGLVISMFIREFVYLVNREQYLQVISVVPFVMGPAIISTFFVYFTPGLLLANKTHLMWIPSVVQILVLFAIGPILIKNYQLHGIIVCNYLTTSAYVLVSHFMTQRYYPIPVRYFSLASIIGLYIFLVWMTSCIDYERIYLNIVLKGIVLALILFILWLVLFKSKNSYAVKVRNIISS